MAESIVSRYLNGHSEFADKAFVEIGAGKKTVEWHWLLFPIPEGLSTHPLSEYYQISNSKEANAYYENLELRGNFHKALKLMLDKSVFSMYLLFDGGLEHIHACLTMFNSLYPEDKLIKDCIDYFFHGKAHSSCMQLILDDKFVLT